MSVDTMATEIVIHVVRITSGIVIFFLGMWCERRRSRQIGRRNIHHNNPEALEMEQHLLSHQKPASLLGIHVSTCTGNYLALAAPLSLNTNVHGTAFAGSLYSILVLTCYYATRSWLLQQVEIQDYVLVAKSAKIQYKQPVKDCELIRAWCNLPSEEVLETFRQELVGSEQKACLQVESQVQNSNAGGLACTCVVELCAYKCREDE